MSGPTEKRAHERPGKRPRPEESRGLAVCQKMLPLLGRVVQERRDDPAPRGGHEPSGRALAPVGRADGGAGRGYGFPAGLVRWIEGSELISRHDRPPGIRSEG